MLEQCRVVDLLVKNYGDNVTTYDVGIVIRVVESYVSFILSTPSSRIFVVGRLVDGYHTLLARDENLKGKSFQALAEAWPKNARYCHDNLYRAIDMYLKAHPSLTETESSVCRAMEYHKLSQDAHKHVMKNDQLPLNITTRFILLEQVNMTRSMTSLGLNYQRTRSQAIIRVSGGMDEISKGDKDNETRG
ncbi:hypothetical protein L1049_019414 [Liquidambar formosana]|uniref:NPH3 domain-containing protein n=1 Tax=Liquidambar formosana TaxID=63359 RepID=A0AAP0SBP7_LIQFO